MASFTQENRDRPILAAPGRSMSHAGHNRPPCPSPLFSMVAAMAPAYGGPASTVARSGAVMPPIVRLAAAIAALSFCPSAWAATPQPADLLIAGGRIHDGSGAPA